MTNVLNASCVKNGEMTVIESIVTKFQLIFNKSFRHGYILGKLNVPRSHCNFSLMGYSASREAEHGYALGLTKFKKEEKRDD